MLINKKRSAGDRNRIDFGPRSVSASDSKNDLNFPFDSKNSNLTHLNNLLHNSASNINLVREKKGILLPSSIPTFMHTSEAIPSLLTVEKISYIRTCQRQGVCPSRKPKGQRRQGYS